MTASGIRSCVAVMTLVIGAIFLRDTKDVDITTGSGVASQHRT